MTDISENLISGFRQAEPLKKGESIESYAARRYLAQMSYYEAWGGHDLAKWHEVGQDVRDHWIETTRALVEGDSK